MKERSLNSLDVNNKMGSLYLSYLLRRSLDQDYDIEPRRYHSGNDRQLIQSQYIKGGYIGQPTRYYDRNGLNSHVIGKEYKPFTFLSGGRSKPKWRISSISDGDGHFTR